MSKKTFGAIPLVNNCNNSLRAAVTMISIIFLSIFALLMISTRKLQYEYFLFFFCKNLQKSWSRYVLFTHTTAFSLIIMPYFCAFLLVIFNIPAVKTHSNTLLHAVLQKPIVCCENTIPRQIQESDFWYPNCILDYF